MADERCVFPGDTPPRSPAADPSAAAPRPEDRSRHRWLNPDAAERLLRGDPPDNAVPPEDRPEAERLARSLGALAALSAPPAADGGELPGESAALAAFRTARAAPAAGALPASAGTGAPADPTPHSATDVAPARASVRPAGAVRAAGGAGRESASSGAAVGIADADADADIVVRIGGHPTSAPVRRRRPLRLGLAAALAVGMVGGIAAATGALPTPFDRSGPGPAASAPAAPTSPPARPPVTAPAEDTSGTGEGTGPSEGVGEGRRGSDDAGAVSPEAGAPLPGRSVSGAPPTGAAPDTERRLGAVLRACREVGAGRKLDPERRRALEGAAGGRALVRAYCSRILAAPENRHPRADDKGDAHGRGGDGAGRPRGRDGKGGTGRDGKGGGNGKGDRDGKGAKAGKGDGDGKRGGDGDRRRDRPRRHG